MMSNQDPTKGFETHLLARKLNEGAMNIGQQKYVVPCLVIVATLCVAIFMSYSRPILVPLLFAFFFTYLTDPIVNCLVRFPNEACCLRFFPSSNDEDSAEVKTGFLEQTSIQNQQTINQQQFPVDRLPVVCRCCIRSFHVPRFIAVLLTLSIGCGIISLMGLVIFESINDVKDNLHKYEQGAKNLAKWFGTLFKRFGLSWTDDVQPRLISRIEVIVGYLAESSVTFLEQVVMSLIFLTYFLSTPIRPKEGIWYLVNTQVQQYIRLKASLSLLLAVTNGFILQWLSVDLPWLFALVTFICNFIPNVGAIFSTLLPGPLIILDPNLSATARFLAMFLPFMMHQLIGNFIEPKVFGKILDIHAIVVLVALGAFSILWGIVGMILAVPLAAVIRIISLEMWGVDCMLVKMIEGRLFEKYGSSTKQQKEKKDTEELIQIHVKPFAK